MSSRGQLLIYSRNKNSFLVKVCVLKQYFFSSKVICVSFGIIFCKKIMNVADNTRNVVFWYFLETFIFSLLARIIIIFSAKKIRSVLLIPDTSYEKTSYGFWCTFWSSNSKEEKYQAILITSTNLHDTSALCPLFAHFTIADLSIQWVCNRQISVLYSWVM